TVDGLIRILTGGNTSVGNVVANGSGRGTTVIASTGDITVTGTATSTLSNVTLTASAGNLTVNAGATALGGGTVTANCNKNRAFVLGTAAADTFNVNSVANPSRVEVSGNRVQYAGAGAGGLEYLELAGGAGGDTYNVYFSGLVTPETRVNAGSGSDVANLFGT